MTNFDGRVPCPGDMYRSGAVCYRNCEIIGMENCGIGACTSNSNDCAWQILNMVKGVIEGVGKGIGTVMSFGASTAVKSAAKMGMKAAMKGLA